MRNTGKQIASLQSLLQAHGNYIQMNEVKIIKIISRKSEKNKSLNLKYGSDRRIIRNRTHRHKRCTQLTHYTIQHLDTTDTVWS